MNACLGPATLLAASTVCSLTTTTSADAAWDTQVLTYLLFVVIYYSLQYLGTVNILFNFLCPIIPLNFRTPL